MTRNDKQNIFGRVVHIGPDISAIGGIASVLKAYRDTLPRFVYLRTNSRRGFVPGLLRWGASLCMLPWLRVARGVRVAHVHSGPGKSFRRKTTFLAMARLCGMRTVFHCHAGAIKITAQQYGAERFKRQMAKCDHIISLSRAWHDYFASQLGMPRVSVLPNMVTMSPAQQPTALEAGQQLHILFLGTIVCDKGIFDLLETLAAHRDQWRGRVVLRIGGQGAESQRMADYISQNGLQDMAQPLGWVDGQNKQRQLQWCHVVALPSYIEGLPITLLEGMCQGKGIISTTVGGIPEIVTDGENGLLITPGDQQALARAIEAYMRQPELVAQHGAQSMARIQPYLPQAVTAQLEAIYRQILS